jgi:uncharacterized GH25 family protein
MRKIHHILPLFILFFSVSVFAHELWLVPQKYIIKKGETISLFANTGHNYPISVSAVTPDRVGNYILAGDSGSRPISNYEVREKSLAADVSFERQGTFTAALSVKPRIIKLDAESFNDYLQHSHLKSVYDLRKKEGIVDKNAVEQYSKYPKTIVQVGRILTDSPLSPLGLKIEIIPLKNPYTLKEGDRLDVRVLFEGNPLPEKEIAWTYPGAKYEFAGSTFTDKSGMARIPLSKSGPYVIRTIHMEWVKKDSHEWESFWASLTFEVKSRLE